MAKKPAKKAAKKAPAKTVSDAKLTAAFNRAVNP